MNAKPRTLSGFLPVISGLISLVLAASTEAATITWGTPVAVDINNASQVTNGVMIGQAFSGQASVMTVNGIVFNTDLPEITSTPNNETQGQWVGFGPQATDYAKLLSGGLFSLKDSAATITGLTAGKKYILQVFTAYSGSYPGGEQMQLGNSSDYSNGGVLMGNTCTNPTYVIGTFTADATSQSFHWRAAPGAGYSYLGAVQVRELGSVDKAIMNRGPAKEMPIPGETLLVKGCTAFLIVPAQGVASNSQPWVWYAPTLHGLPNQQEKWMFKKFLDAGIAVAGIDVGESYGSPAGRALFTAFYDELTARRGLSKTPCLLARSRGGLQLYNWAAEHPDAVAGVAGIYPVCDLRSYPGLAQACGAYGMTADELQVRLADHNPVDRLAPLAQAHIPIFHLHGDSDTVVPIEKNSGELAQRYRQLGGQMTLKVIKGQGHNVWEGWFTSQELVDFVIECSLTGPAGKPSPKGGK